MKKNSIIILVLAFFAFSVSITSCSPDEPAVVPTTVDTTDTTEEEAINNQMKVGFDLYQIKADKTLTDGYYNSATNKTIINVNGNDGDLGDADFEITIPGSSTGTFTVESDGATFEGGTGTVGDVKRKQYNAAGSVFSITISEYGGVGEKIIGTFSGKVKDQNNRSVDISQGKFEVFRAEDQ